MQTQVRVDMSVGFIQLIMHGEDFGNVRIATSADDVAIFDTVGIATTSAGDCALKVGSGTSCLC